MPTRAKTVQKFKQGYSEPDSRAYTLHALFPRVECCSKTSWRVSEGDSASHTLLAPLYRVKCCSQTTGEGTASRLRHSYPPCAVSQSKMLFLNYRRGYSESIPALIPSMHHFATQIVVLKLGNFNGTSYKSPCNLQYVIV